MQGDEILRIIRRITRDFAPLLPGLRLEVVPPEGFRARVRGKPIIADEAMLRAVLVEEAARAAEKRSRPRQRESPRIIPGSPGTTWGGEVRGRPLERYAPGRIVGGAGTSPTVGAPKAEGRPGKHREARGGTSHTPGAVTPADGRHGSPEGRDLEEREGSRARERMARKDLEAKYPLYALPSSRVIMVEMESLAERVNREDRRLHRPLVEGLVLREVLYLITSGQPLPEPRARAERILRRHWPFQYAALRSVGLTVTGFESSHREKVLGRDN